MAVTFSYYMLERSGNGVQLVGDSMLCNARQRPYPQPQHNTATLPLCNKQTNSNELYRAPDLPGEGKLHRVRNCEHATKHARPVAHASSSPLTATENQLAWR